MAIVSALNVIFLDNNLYSIFNFISDTDTDFSESEGLSSLQISTSAAGQPKSSVISQSADESGMCACLLNSHVFFLIYRFKMKNCRASGAPNRNKNRTQAEPARTNPERW